MAVGHLRYHQNMASGQYPPVEERLELLWATLAGIRGIRYVMGHEVGHWLRDRVFLMRQRLRRMFVQMWWSLVKP